MMDINDNEREILDHIRDILRRLSKKGTQKQLYLFFHKYHEADIADALEGMPLEERQQFFQKLKPDLAADVLEEMDPEFQLQLLSEVKTDKVARFIEEMEPDDAVDLLEELLEEDEAKAEEIIDALPKKEADDLKELLAYEEGTAGALMTSQYLWILENHSVQDAINMFREKVPPDSELSFYIYIVNQKGALVGVTSLRNLVLSDLKQTIKSIRNEAPIMVNHTTDQEQVALMMQKYNLVVLPVVDDHGKLIGVITVDDVVDVVVDEATEDLYKLSGTNEIDETKLLYGRVYLAVFSRIPWLLLTVFGGIVASYVMKYYALKVPGGFFSMALFLSFVPLLMGLGGNVGNQSATIIVRGLSTGVLRDRTAVQIIFREVTVGALIGLSVSVLVWTVMVITQHDRAFASIVAISIGINSVVAAFLGASLPILFKQFKIDPAVASAPFISTTLDILGQIIYFVMMIFSIFYFLS